MTKYDIYNCSMYTVICSKCQRNWSDPMYLLVFFMGFTTAVSCMANCYINVTVPSSHFVLLPYPESYGGKDLHIMHHCNILKINFLFGVCVLLLWHFLIWRWYSWNDFEMELGWIEREDTVNVCHAGFMLTVLWYL